MCAHISVSMNNNKTKKQRTISSSEQPLQERDLKQEREITNWLLLKFVRENPRTYPHTECSQNQLSSFIAFND